MYMCMEASNDNGKMSLISGDNLSDDSKAICTVEKNTGIKNNVNTDGTYCLLFCKYLNQHGGTSGKGFAGWKDGISDKGSLITLTEKKKVSTTIPGGYSARCVTTSNGYYDITLNERGSYQLPDSFRGLGTVGIYGDSYNMRIDQFDGNGSKIDMDIYISRFQNDATRVDNYFDAIHDITTQSLSSTKYFEENADGQFNYGQGIGLFNTYLVKSDTNKIFDFTLTGSVIVENIATSGEIVKGDFANITWLCAGGVCGFVKGTGQLYDHNYEGIILKNLSISGINRAAGILADSGLSDNNKAIRITNCSADELSITIKNSNSANAFRNTIGAFVGRTKESKVIINGDKENGGSTVKIKEFSSGKGTVGGLVGYAGNGCEVYNMKVCPSNSVVVGGNSVILGNRDSSMSGGIVGLMQPYTADVDNNNCSAIFDNCIVENINISGNYAGGIYGGTWGDDNKNNNGWNPVSIVISNCEVVGKSSESMNVINGKKYAGGIVAFGRISKDGNPNVQINDTTVRNYKITADGSNYVGGMIGYCNSNNSGSNVICYVYNSSVENCILGTGTNYSGGIIGKIYKNDANRILGYNVKLDNVTSGSTNMGAWVGYLDKSDTNTSIQFTGMAIYGKGFDKNIGNWNVGATLNNANFVFADYMGACNGKLIPDSEGNNIMIYPKDVSGLNATDNVSMPSYPFVNINPQSKIGVYTSTDEQGITTTTEEIISGDGAVLLADKVDYSGFTSELTRATQIFADTQLEDKNATNYSRRYTTFVNSTIYAENTIEHYLSRTLNDDGDRISTYKTETGSLPANVADFAVVVIANTNDTETTNLINRYIQLVTNTTTDYTTASDYYNIEVSSCEFSGGRFAVTEATPGLTWTPPSGSSSGSFALNGAYADSKKTNSFTLVDVQFKDPLHTDKIAYHLYVPVYTIKQIEVDFSVAVKTGTSSVSYLSGVPSTIYSASMGKDGTHIDSLQTWITQYIRFSYSEEDINVLLSSGNVKWNHEKSVIFDTQNFSDTEIRLPNNTYMVLVDPNGNSDRQYYARASDFATYRNITNNKDGWKIDLTTFKRGENDYFSVKSLAELIDPYLVVTENPGKGSYVDGTAEDYDAYKIDAGSGEVHYYKYIADKTGNYDLTVTQAINEDYYISMFVPKSEDYGNELYFYSIVGPSELSGVKAAKVNKINSFNVLVADLYTQETSSLVVSPDDQQINASNKLLAVKASTSITINNAYARAHLSGTKLFHSFNLSLDRYTEEGVSSDIQGLGKDKITAKYSIGAEANKDSTAVTGIDLQSNYLNIVTTEIMTQLLLASEKDTPFVISAYIEMDFDENKLEAEFPQKSSDSNIGVNVAATSNLSYDSSRLAFTSMTEAFAPDSHYYYRESVNSAILYYSAVSETDEYESFGKLSQNQSRLGVNGYCSDLSKMPINTEVLYNVSAISSDDLALAKNLRLTIMLSKKTDMYDESGAIFGVEYSQVNDLRKYLNEVITVTSGTIYSKSHQISEQSPGKLVVDIPIGSCKGESDIYSFGVGFQAITGQGFTEYANYRVTVRAELLKEDGSTIDNSGASDYIVYTNAKVYPEVMSEVN